MPVVELQALMAALTLTGLFLGVMVDERQRAEEGLRQTLRLAAAGEMAGAIAHEVNQPLTAVANYGRSAQMLLERDQARSALMREIDRQDSRRGRSCLRRGPQACATSFELVLRDWKPCRPRSSWEPCVA